MKASPRCSPRWLSGQWHWLCNIQILQTKFLAVAFLLTWEYVWQDALRVDWVIHYHLGRDLVCVRQKSEEWWTKLLDVTKGIFPVKIVKGVFSVYQQNCFCLIFFKYLSHGVYWGLNTGVLTCACLKRTSSIYVFKYASCCKYNDFSDNPLQYFIDADRSHTRISLLVISFVKGD